MSEKIREEQINFLQKIKPIFSSSVQPEVKIENQKISNVNQGIDNPKFEELLKRIEKIEEMMGGREEETIRKGKVKEEIISLLQQHKKLTSTQLSKLVRLSRTRCSEYFRELTKEGLTEGIIINRQKYYKLVGK